MPRNASPAAEQILVRRRWLLPVVPVLSLLVILSNLFGKGLSWLPSSQFMPAFYRVAAERERRDEGNPVLDGASCPEDAVKVVPT